MSPPPVAIPPELLAAVRRHDADEVTELLVAMPERQRRAAASDLQDRTMQPLVGRAWRSPALAQRHTAQAVWFGTGLARDLRWSQFLLVGFDGTHPRLHEVLAARPAKVRDGLVRGMLVHDPHLYWHVVRVLVDDGTVTPDVEVEYLEAMVRWLGFAGYDDGLPRDPVPHVVEQLTTDPGLVARLWRAFELEPVVEAMATNVMAEALVAAAEHGAVERERLLAVAVGGLLRDLRPGTAGFFRRIAVGLDPSPAELRVHADALVRVLANAHPPDQRLAASWLRQLSADGVHLDASTIAAAAATPLSGRQKGAAVEALRLLGALELPPSRRAHAVLPALGHEHQDVQALALDLLERDAGGGPLPVDVRSELLGWASSLAPALRPRVAALVGSDPEVADAGHDEVAAVDVDGLATRIERLPTGVRDGLGLGRALELVRAGGMPPPATFAAAAAPERGAAVSPVADVDELVEVLTVLLAGSGGAVDLERAIDGIARTPWTELTPGAAGALRAAAPWEPHGWGGWSAQELVLVAVHHWRQGLTPPRLAHLRRAKRRSPLAHDLAGPKLLASTFHWMYAFDGYEEVSGLTGMVAGRLWEAATAGVRGPRPTLALPSTTDGWLHLDDLIRRIEARGRRDVPDRYDAVQALLRLHPADRQYDRGLPRGALAAALARWCDPSAPPPEDEGLRRALGVTVPSPGRLVTAAVPHRYEYRGDVTVVRFDVASPDGARRRDDPVGELHAELRVPEGPIDIDDWWTPFASALPPADRLLARWSALALPRHRPLLDARAVSLLAEDPDQNRSSDAMDAVVGELVDPDRPLDRAAHVLVAVALLVRNDAVAAAGVDVVAAATADGRLDPEALGAALAELTAVGVARPARVAERLGRVVDESVPTAEAVRRAVQMWLAGLDELPRDAHAPLELLERACDRAGRGVDLDAARALLATGSTGGSKRARSAQRLLAVPDHAPSSLAGWSLERQVERAERWAAPAGS